jgi:hypothetical protein
VDAVPTSAQAAQLLVRTLADQPTANGGLVSGGDAAGVACVFAAIALDPGTLAFPEGREVPLIAQDFGPEVLMHAMPWPHEACADDEREAARLLLDDIVSELPSELWRNDG